MTKHQHKQALLKLLEIGESIGRLAYRISDYAGTEAQEDALIARQDRLQEDAKVIIAELLSHHK